jgi:hypothetical protein
MLFNNAIFLVRRGNQRGLAKEHHEAVMTVSNAALFPCF